MDRSDGRKFDETRGIKITKGYLKYAPGSVLIEFGNTKVLCAVTIEDRVPPFLKGTGKGWLTGEYNMLPASTLSRKPRESSRGRVEGRTYEIQRMIGRALRAVVNLDNIGEKTLWVDCDVIQADGGTRTAAITGSFIALMIATKLLVDNGQLKEMPVTDYIAAISVGIVDGKCLLDLNFSEDAKAQVDLNVVMTDKGKFVEVQGTGETGPFSQDELTELLMLSKKGIQEIIGYQKQILEEYNE